MLGRLASTVAKQLLQGQHVVVVRTEGICLSGGMVRRKQKMGLLQEEENEYEPEEGSVSLHPTVENVLESRERYVAAQNYERESCL